MFYNDSKLLSMKHYSVGAYVSGGLDSTIMLCMMLTELRNINRLDIPVTCFTISKSDGPTFYATQVIKKVEEKFSVKLIHKNEIPNDLEQDKTGDIGPTPIKDIHSQNIGMVVYMGINRMAPDDIRPFRQKLNNPYIYGKDSVFRAPFINLHKPQILDIYFKLGCEDLITYTHSCTVLKEGACGECYSCAERKWGFDSLGKTDPGTIIV